MNAKVENFVKNLGSGLSLFSSIIISAGSMLLFFNPGSDLVLKILLTIALTVIKTAMFHTLLKTLKARINFRLVAVFVVDIAGMLILLFTSISKLVSLSVLVLWLVVSLVLALFGLPRPRKQQ
jgi:phosphatidylserine synthase